MGRFLKQLAGGDLRSLGQSRTIIARIKNQNDFDELFQYLFYDDRLIVMRTADVVEKITIRNPEYLFRYKKEIIGLCYIAKDKEFKWHLALLIPRLQFSTDEFKMAWETLTKWTRDRTNSNIVRVNSLQGLFELMEHKRESLKDFNLILAELEKENIPSLNARIKKLKLKQQLNNTSLSRSTT